MARAIKLPLGLALTDYAVELPTALHRNVVFRLHARPLPTDFSVRPADHLGYG